MDNFIDLARLQCLKLASGLGFRLKNSGARKGKASNTTVPTASIDHVYGKVDQEGHQKRNHKWRPSVESVESKREDDKEQRQRTEHILTIPHTVEYVALSRPITLRTAGG